jgi:hypothetical protein
VYEWLGSLLPWAHGRGTWRWSAALQERAGSKMVRALGDPVEGETWEGLKHIALE